MGLFRMLLIGVALIVSLPIAAFVFLALRFQYTLLKGTKTKRNLGLDDPIWSLEEYQRLFAHRKWAHIESFACAKEIPLSRIRRSLLQSQEGLVSEVFRVVWNRRVNMQSGGAPSDVAPTVGSRSQSSDIRAEVVGITPQEMSMAITTVHTNFTGGLETVTVEINPSADVMIVTFKYLWHNDIILPRKWKQWLGVYMQLTSRRMWLLDLAAALTSQ
ncbi:hypothetical protein JX265_003803 [Neoarthrinium moseri]|uniref:Uncharacterized protein n=1 Tax=Neoarthrinium moseri TaxID=1658444 RepID=A0A9P9WTG0_9PEZI|nr:uncharacterized protein JN550_002546 [Neoarthrinium moseri]KAI1843907.1 hypothetical protein JX266_009963 [Neoarthrinium moseri]KAI1875117.1 hypothetical protein JN550_002546 [Neoarthrinium moseri]KAI1877795.1 hypothetical protein JX265_003803 [Neoarthrinium moseri]